MLNRFVVLMLVFLVACVPVTFGQNNNEKDIKQAEKIKSAVAKMGTGTDVQVKVDFKDGTKLNGYISEIKTARFVIVDEKIGTAREVLYTQVKQTKRKNSNKGLVIAGIAVGIAAIVGLIIAGNND